MEKISIESILHEIREEQESLKRKKSQVQDLIKALEDKLELHSQKQSYRGRSYLQGEMIKALVTAHSLDIQLSNTLLKSYDQLAKLLKDLDQKDEIPDEILDVIIRQLHQGPTI